MVFPVAKLAYLAMKQASKPLVNALKARSKTSPFMRNFILIPPAQIYHTLDTNIRLRLLNMGKAKEVKPLDPEMAAELGAEMLGEFIMFSVGSAIIYLEYRRQTKGSQAKEDVQNSKLIELEQEVKELGLIVEQHTAEVRELTRLLHASNPEASNLPSRIVDRKSGTVLEIKP